ncbi:MAG: OmpA family protein [Burkholderiales bacterium]
MNAPRFAPFVVCTAAALMSACGFIPLGNTSASSVPTPTSSPAPAASATPTASAASAARTVQAAPSLPVACLAPSEALDAPAPVSFQASITRAGQQLLDQASRCVGNEARTLVIDPLIDANTGAQTVSTVSMGEQLAALVKSQHGNWHVQPLTRKALAEKPLLLIGTLTPVTVERSVDTVPDAFRVWLTVIDLRSGRVVAKQIDRATVASVNPEPLKFYQDSPSWSKDRAVRGYINSCQINTRIGDLADPDYLAMLPASAVVNEAIIAYNAGRVPAANGLYKEAATLADGEGDLRALNGLYLTSWQLGKQDAARAAFSKLVATGLDLKQVPIKFLFKPGGTDFYTFGDLAQQYEIWVATLAREIEQARSCVRIVGHTSRTGSASLNDRLSRKRAETLEQMLEHDNRRLATRLSALGVGSREALVGLGTDDLRDALDRRVEFRVVDCV